MIRENKDAPKEERWTIICDECGKSLNAQNEQAVMHKAAFAGKWLGDFMGGGKLRVGSMYHEAMKLHLCSIGCAKDYKAKHNYAQ